MSEATTQTQYIQWTVQAQDFKVLANPNPAAPLDERYVGYCNDGLSVSGPDVDILVRAMLRKHLPTPIGRGRVVALARSVSRHMADALRPKS